MWNKSHSDTKIAIKKLSKNSLLGPPSILTTFPFSSVKRCVNMYSIFRIEPIHLFSFGITRMLEENLWNLFEVPNKTSSAIKTVGGNLDKPFRTIRRSVFRNLNIFIQHSAMSCTGLFTRVLNCFKSNSSQLCGLFTETDFLAMLRAADYESLDKITSFFGVFVNKLCEFYKKSLTTKKFLK